MIGIDPGKSGGLASITSDGDVEVVAMPIAGKELNVVSMCDWIYAQTKKYGTTIVCVEKVHAMPNQGSVSMFTFGKTVGVVYGAVTAMLLPLYEVSPQAWKKAVLFGTQKDKDAAIDYCTRVYPKVSLLATPRSKKPHDGMADALCIARYALEKYKDVL